MYRMGTPLLTTAALAFIASTAVHALSPSPSPAPPPWADLFDSPPPQVQMARMFLHPANPGMIALLVATWAALIYHLARLWLERHRLAQARLAAEVRGRRLTPQSAGPPVPGDLLRLHDRDDSLREHGPLILALLAGAVWPWILPLVPVTGLLLPVLTLAGALTAALRGVRSGAEVRYSSTLGFIAGWALLACLAVFADLLHDRLGVPQQIAAIIALMIGAVAAVAVQLRMPRRIGFSVAVIWGLIGIASSTVLTDGAIATITVMAIAIVAVALVRVLT